MRLFVALPLPAEIRDALAQICGGIAGTRWVEPQYMHLTLRFAGELDRGQADDLHMELAAIRYPEFDLALRGIGAFERRGHVTMLWAGIDEPRTLIGLRDRVEAAAVRAGLEPEPRKFTPHITLCRFKPNTMPEIGPYLEMHNAFSTPAFSLREFSLYQSHLGHGGARYEQLHDYPLQELVYYDEATSPHDAPEQALYD